MLGLPKGSLGERSWMGCKEVGRRLGLFRSSAAGRAPRRKRPSLLEALEDRTLMATSGVDYVVKNGFSWSNPSRITYSIAPDGVQWISGVNGMNSAFDAKFGRGVWEREIARALATWQSVANINIVPIKDGPYRVNALGAPQGDARFGDIRIGGDAIPSNHQTLAQTYFPPPQGSTAGGDVEINLNMAYAIGGDYDVFSVVLHETGHSLGLDHPTSDKVVMRPIYGGVVTTLAAGDIEGIQSIYGARQRDMYQSQGYGVDIHRPIDLTAPLATSQTFTASAASLNRVGDVEWFSFVAPSYASGSWQVTASASNSSMLSPKVVLYDANGRQLGQASKPGSWSTDVSASSSSIVPGQRYFAAVTGATGDVFSIGSYNLTVSLSSAPRTTPPVVIPPPPVVIPPTTPVTPIPPSTGPIYSTSVVVAPDRFELNNSIGTATRLGRVVQAKIGGLTLPAADVDFFSFQSGGMGVYQVSAGGANIQILNNRGRVVAQGTNSVNVSATRNASFVVRVQAAAPVGVADYTLSIGQAAPVRRGPALPRRPIFGRNLARQGAAAPPALLATATTPNWGWALRTTAG
ncbi:Matrixin [Planctomyces sp. SH-PL62]|nr:Matrixin [Planctomyces sp. SH-PL62]